MNLDSEEHAFDEHDAVIIQGNTYNLKSVYSLTLGELGVLEDVVSSIPQGGEGKIGITESMDVVKRLWDIFLVPPTVFPEDVDWEKMSLSQVTKLVDFLVDKFTRL